MVLTKEEERETDAGDELMSDRTMTHDFLKIAIYAFKTLRTYGT